MSQLSSSELKLRTVAEKPARNPRTAYRESFITLLRRRSLKGQSQTGEQVQTNVKAFQTWVQTRESRTTQAKLLASGYSAGARTALLQLNGVLNRVLAAQLSRQQRSEIITQLDKLSDDIDVDGNNLQASHIVSTAYTVLRSRILTISSWRKGLPTPWNRGSACEDDRSQLTHPCYSADSCR